MSDSVNLILVISHSTNLLNHFQSVINPGKNQYELMKIKPSLFQNLKLNYDLIILLLESIEDEDILSSLNEYCNHYCYYVLTEERDIDIEKMLLDTNITNYDSLDRSIKVIEKRIEVLIQKHYTMKKLHDKQENIITLTQSKNNYYAQYNQLKSKINQMDYLLLELLILNPNQIITHQQIHQLNPSMPYNAKLVSDQIQRLRKKLKIIDIESIHGIGYRYSK